MVLCKGKTDDNNVGIDKAKKYSFLDLLNQKKKLCLSFFDNGDECHLYVNKTEICNFTSPGKFTPYEFCLGSASRGFTKWWYETYNIKCNTNHFSICYDVINTNDIISIYEWPMQNYSIKYRLDLLGHCLLHY